MIESNLVAALGPLVGNRVYPDVAPANVTLPFCTYQQVGGKAVNFVGAESSDKKNARIQITVWSKTRKQAMELIREIEDEMVKAPLLAEVVGAAISRYDAETTYRGAMQDFSFWG
jgi:hypothetical protein